MLQKTCLLNKGRIYFFKQGMEEDDATPILVVERTKNRIVFDVHNIPPKWCVALRSSMRYAVPTMRAHLCVVHSDTDTAMDYMWWTNRISQLALECPKVDDFNFVDECKCEAGGPCCEATLTLSITNREEHEIPVYSDDIISSDPRVKVVHGTFSVVYLFNTPEGVGVETNDPHTFSDGDLVTVLDSACHPPLPKWLRAVKCGKKSLVLENLFGDQECLQITENISFSTHADMVGHISKRQLLYTLNPGETVSVVATVRKGTGRDSIKWSPIGGLCSYRPLFRDLKVDNRKLDREQLEQLVQICPKRVFDIEDLTGDVVMPNIDDCDGCLQCVSWAIEQGLNPIVPPTSCGEDCPGPGREKRSKRWKLPQICWDCGAQLEDPNTVQFPKKRLFEWHRFTVETNGSLEAADVVTRGLGTLQRRLKQKSQAAGTQPKEFPALK